MPISFEKDILYRLALRNIPNIGDITAKKLIQTFGSAHLVFENNHNNELKKNISKSLKSYLDNSSFLDDAKKELDYMNKNNINYWCFDDSDYPNLLQHCLDSPTILFYKGNINLKNTKIISIVGTRKATSYGLKFLENFVETIAPFNPIIVSGFASGIDIAAHKMAFKHNLQTIACLGHGFHMMYPAAHKIYTESMLKNGGFISDFQSINKINPKNFIQRNRIVAGISKATIIIESGPKGGSLTTADMAFSYNREVFALPGRNSDYNSKGCNYLIQNYKAQLLNDPNDFIKMMNWIKETKSIQKTFFVELNPEEQKIVSYLEKNKKKSLDSIAKECYIPIHKTTVILLELELKGIIRPLPGKFFELN